MHILLINANPVVSRLLLLCTRDDTVSLYESSNVGEIQSDVYDIVFVDEASYGRDVAELLVKMGTAKKVFISYRNDSMRGFDMTVKKPFLPSKIIDIIQNFEVLEKEIEIEIEDITIENDEPEEEILTIFSLNKEENEKEISVIEDAEDMSAPIVLDSNEIDKIKTLLDMDEDELELPIEDLSDDEYEMRKIEVIKEKLIADGLEIVGEEEIVEVLSSKSEKKKEKKRKSKSKNKKNKKKEIAFTEEELESIEDAIEVAVGTVTKKQMKQLLKGKKIDVSIEIEGDK